MNTVWHTWKTTSVYRAIQIFNRKETVRPFSFLFPFTPVHAGRCYGAYKLSIDRSLSRFCTSSRARCVRAATTYLLVVSRSEISVKLSITYRSLLPTFLFDRFPDMRTDDTSGRENRDRCKSVLKYLRLPVIVRLKGNVSSPKSLIY